MKERWWQGSGEGWVGRKEGTSIEKKRWFFIRNKFYLLCSMIRGTRRRKKREGCERGGGSRRREGGRERGREGARKEGAQGKGVRREKGWVEGPVGHCRF